MLRAALQVHGTPRSSGDGGQPRPLRHRLVSIAFERKRISHFVSRSQMRAKRKAFLAGEDDGATGRDTLRSSWPGSRAERAARVMSIVEGPLQGRMSEDRAVLEELVRSVPLFESVGEEGTRLLSEHLGCQAVGVGDLVVRQGELGDVFYVMLCGSCEVWCQRPGTAEPEPARRAAAAPTANRDSGAHTADGAATGTISGSVVVMTDERKEPTESSSMSDEPSVDAVDVLDGRRHCVGDTTVLGQCVQLLNGGDTFGELALLERNGTRQATVRAQTPGTVMLTVERAQFDTVVR